MKNRLKLLAIIFFIATALVVASGLRFHDHGSLTPNSEASQYTDEVVERVVGGHTVFVPKEYLKFRTSSIGQKSMLLHAWFPGAAPPPSADSHDLRVNKGIWWKNIRILVGTQFHPTNSFHQGVIASVKHLKATVFVGEQYGLEHYTQEADGNPDAYDVWYEKENAKVISYLTCSEKLTESSVPQCSILTRLDRVFSLKISFDKRLLPHWKTIKTNTLRMSKSFLSREAAILFIQNQISLVTSKKENE